MVAITLDLIRKRSEHNEGELSTLEEIALHQENIDKIDLLNSVCRELRILLLQHNLISRIENLNMLKKLEYLNLALNNIEAIENLEGLESLKKLDLTVNFIGNLEGVEKLRRNELLEQLILTGNPCTDYEGYREYVVATLPQLRELDMRQIERSERIQALQVYAEARGEVIRGYRKYAKIRANEMNQCSAGAVQITEISEDDEEFNEDEDSKFWKSTSKHTPEIRIEIAKRLMKNEQRKNNSSRTDKQERKYVPKLFSPQGRPYNVNQAGVSFKLNDEDERINITLSVKLRKHLDTTLVDVDVQPNYVRVTIKGKVLQLTLPCEVRVDSSTAKRSEATGNLLITMPRLRPLEVVTPAARKPPKITVRATPLVSKRQWLEIGPANELDFSKIVENSRKKSMETKAVPRGEKIENFVDNPEVPPLE